MKMKSIMAGCIMTAAIIVLASGCADTGPGMEGSEEVGSVLRVLEFAVDVPLVDILGGATVDGTITMMSFELENAGLTEDSPPQTGIHVESYTVEYNSDDAGAVDLSSLEDFIVNVYLGPGEVFSGTDWPVVTPETKLEFFMKKGGVINDVVRYDVIVTFNGVNDYGQSIEARGGYTIFFSDY